MVIVPRLDYARVAPVAGGGAAAVAVAADDAVVVAVRS
jgi:hypothetical protein